MAAADRTPRAAGLAIAAACMTRYEAWPICGALIALAFVVLVRRGASAARGGARGRPSCRLSGRRRRHLSAQQPLDGWRVVRQRRLLRRRERSARPSVPRVAAGARRRLSPVGIAARLAGVRRRLPSSCWTFVRAKERASLTLVLALARRGGAAVVRVLRGTSIPDPLRRASGRRRAPPSSPPASACCRVRSALLRPRSPSPQACGRSRRSIALPRSSPNRSATPATRPDGRP